MTYGGNGGTYDPEEPEDAQSNELTTECGDESVLDTFVDAVNSEIQLV